MSANCEPNERTTEALIDPSTPAENGGLDNVFFGLIVYENMQIVDPADHIYTVTGSLGQGQFGHVYSVTHEAPDGEILNYAMKISKSTAESHNQFEYEAQALSYIKGNAPPELMEYLTDIQSYFLYHNHICIVLDHCGKSMFQVLKDMEFTGLPLSRVQSVIKDVLIGLNTLSQLSIIHCDVKPENIVQVNDLSERVKLIDLGSCSIVNSSQVPYAQSRYYRAPEVALRLEYDTKADIWSTGCVAAELMLGLPLFPGETERHLICLINQMLGPYPDSMRNSTERHDELFLPDEVLKSPELICQESGECFTQFQPYFVQDRLDEIIMNYIFPSDLSQEQIQAEIETRQVFIEFLQQLLQLDPSERPTAAEALQHPFMTLQFQ